MNVVGRGSSFTWRDFGVRAAPVGILAIVWEILVAAGIVNPAALPQLTHVFTAWLDLAASGKLAGDTSITLYRAFTGLALGVAVGTVTGVWMSRSRRAHLFIDPVVTLTYPLPKTALIPLTMIWLGVTDTAAILVVFLSTLVPMVINAYQGGQSTSRFHVWSAQAMGASPRDILWGVVIPTALPYIMNGTRIALAFSIIVIVAAEMIASRSGIGRLIFLFGESGAYAYMFACVLSVMAAAFLLDRVFVASSHRILAWMDIEDNR